MSRGGWHLRKLTGTNQPVEVTAQNVVESDHFRVQVPLPDGMKVVYSNFQKMSTADMRTACLKECSDAVVPIILRWLDEAKRQQKLFDA